MILGSALSLIHVTLVPSRSMVSTPSIFSAREPQDTAAIPTKAAPAIKDNLFMFIPIIISTNSRHLHRCSDQIYADKYIFPIFGMRHINGCASAIVNKFALLSASSYI